MHFYRLTGKLGKVTVDTFFTLSVSTDYLGMLELSKWNNNVYFKVP